MPTEDPRPARTPARGVATEDARPLRTPARGVATGSAPTVAEAPARGTPDLGALVDSLAELDDESPAGLDDDPLAGFGEDSVQESVPEVIARAASGAASGPLSGPASGRVRARSVPVGEFDQGHAALEQDKLRSDRAQATIKRAAASAATAPSRIDPNDASGSETGRFDRLAEHTVDPSLGDAIDFESDATAISTPGASQAPTGKRFDHLGDRVAERTVDPSLGDAVDFESDATAISTPGASQAPTGKLRTSASLPRRRGIAGDLRYVGTVVLGLRAARRELAVITARQATRQQSRRHHLITLGRAAVTAEGFEHPLLEAARDKLAAIDEERAQHASHVIAADAELVRVRRDREARAKQYATDLAALDGELVALGKMLEPLHKEAAAARKRGVDHHEALRRIDTKIAATEASLESAKGGKLDRAQVQAEIATLRADRKAIQADEPTIAGQLDALNPRIAALEAQRAEAQRKRAELETTERDDQRRVEELLVAIGAKRKVVDRAGSDAEAARDKILLQLGERLYVDRPGDLVAELAPVDAIDLEVGSADRKMMELREILSSVDRWKLVRSIALLAVLVAATTALAGWLIVHQPWRQL